MPRPDVRAERIPQILEAALAVFGRHGFAQARMDDIAQEAGLAKATLYLYFSSKEELIAAILETYFARGLDELTAIRTARHPVADSLSDWVHRRMRELREHPGYGGIGFEFHALATRDPRTRAIIQHAVDQYRSALAAALSAGMERGEIPTADAAELAITIISLTEGLTMLWMLEPQHGELGGVAERAIQNLLKGTQ